MRKSIFYLIAPLLVRAADVKMVGLGYRGGEAVQAGQDITLTITNATEAGSGYPGRKATHFRIHIWNSIYMWSMCKCYEILLYRYQMRFLTSHQVVLQEYFQPRMVMLQ